MGCLKIAVGIGTVFLLLIGIVITGIGFFNLGYAQYKTHWPVAAGHVVASVVRPTPSGRAFTPWIVYRFDVGASPTRVGAWENTRSNKAL